MLPPMNHSCALMCLLASAACGAGHPATSAPPPASVAPAVAAARAPSRGPYQLTAVALPGGTPDGVFLDYLAFDAATGLVWVPVGATGVEGEIVEEDAVRGAAGSLDVIDSASGALTRHEGWKTQELERNGKKRVVGPSSVTIGKDRVYVGNRGDATVCALDPRATAKGTCGALDSMPDGLAFVAATNEVWVTTPRDRSIRILDASTLTQKAKLPFDGEPEGFAVDGTRGRFYTNLEDKDLTLAIDLRTHQTVATWHPACGEDGPHGLRLAEADGLLFVACSAKAETLDVGAAGAGAGAIVGSIDTGDGVDDLDYAAATRTLYVAAAKAATLTVAAVDAKGALTLVDKVATKGGARNGVVDAHGKVYLADGPTSEILIAAPAR
jgi:DNA-binding beta-propeller fold protein YncE